MDARAWLGLTPTHNPFRWNLPVVPGISTGGGFLFGGCGLGAAIAAMEGTTGRPVVWATAQYLSYARPGSVVDVDVTIAGSGRNSPQARGVGPHQPAARRGGPRGRHRDLHGQRSLGLAGPAGPALMAHAARGASSRG